LETFEFNRTRPFFLRSNVFARFLLTVKLTWSCARSAKNRREVKTLLFLLRTSAFALVQNQREKQRTSEMRRCAGNCVFYSGLLSFLKKGICDHAHSVGQSFGQSNLLAAVLARPKKRREVKTLRFLFMTSTITLARQQSENQRTQR
jgi:hypothetical protein